MDSIWTKTCSFPSFPALEGEHHTDVLIIGGGIAGLLCAYNLQKKGIDYMVVDASRILSGTTNGTTGKITAFHGLIYHKLTSSLLVAGILTDHILGKENPYSILFSPSRSILKPQLFFNGLESTKNLLTPSSPRCPHLGCALTWNKAEHSYDCPCHGSRFAKDGTLLNNPANKDLSWAAKKEQKHK